MSPQRLLLALCVPLVLTACSSSSDSPVVSAPRSSSTPSAQATLPVATAYVVTVKKGTSAQDLKEAVAALAKLPGVAGVSTIGTHQLRVDLVMRRLPDEGAAIRSALLKLGTVVVP